MLNLYHKTYLFSIKTKNALYLNEPIGTNVYNAITFYSILFLKKAIRKNGSALVALLNFGFDET